MAHAKREFPLRFPDACYFRFARSASISSMIAFIRVVLFSPPKRQWIDSGRQLEQAGSSHRMKRLERMAHRIALDDTPDSHDGLGRP